MDRNGKLDLSKLTEQQFQAISDAFYRYTCPAYGVSIRIDASGDLVVCKDGKCIYIKSPEPDSRGHVQKILRKWMNARSSMLD